MAKKKRTLSPALKKWHSHLMAYKKDHPGISLKDAMRGAKKTYTR